MNSYASVNGSWSKSKNFARKQRRRRKVKQKKQAQTWLSSRKCLAKPKKHRRNKDDCSQKTCELVWKQCDKLWLCGYGCGMVVAVVVAARVDCYCCRCRCCCRCCCCRCCSSRCMFKTCWDLLCQFLLYHVVSSYCSDSLWESWCKDWLDSIGIPLAVRHDWCFWTLFVCFLGTCICQSRQSHFWKNYFRANLL